MLKEKMDFMEVVNFLVMRGIVEEYEMLFLKEENLRNHTFNDMLVANTEDENWDCLFNILDIPNKTEEEQEKAYNKLEGIGNIGFEDDENTVTFSFNNSRYAILVA